MSENKEILKHCKLYIGGDTNPYKPTEVPNEKWAEEYLKFQIWEAEYSVIQRFTWWKDLWEDRNNGTRISAEEKAEEIYKMAIRDKLRKMEQPEFDFTKMYFEL